MGAKIAMVLSITIFIFTAIIFSPNRNNLSQSKNIPNIKINISIQEKVIPFKDGVEIAIDTNDSKGNSFKLSIYILEKNFNWKYESSSEIEKDGTPINIKDYLLYKSVQSKLENSLDIIAIGLSSQEGKYPEVEEERADLRAQYLKDLLEEKIYTQAEFHKLVIGQYIGKSIRSYSPNETAFQRPIIIIGIYKKDKQINLSKELETVLKKDIKMPILLKNYEQFKLN